MSMSDRVKRLREMSVNAKPSLSTERAELVTDYYKNLATNAAPAVQRARLFAHLMEQKRICILEGELIVGERGPAPKATPT